MEIRKYRNTEIQKYGNMEIWKYRTTELQKYGTTEQQNNRITEQQIYRTTELRNNRITEQQNYGNTEIQNHDADYYLITESRLHTQQNEPDLSRANLLMRQNAREGNGTPEKVTEHQRR